MLVRRTNSAAPASTIQSPPPPISAAPISSIDRAQRLVWKCAAPRPIGEKAKETILRVSEKLKLPPSRVKDIWYGQARRIDAFEMDRLVLVADEVERAQAMAAIELAIELLQDMRHPECPEVIAGLREAPKVLMPPQKLEDIKSSSHPG